MSHFPLSPAFSSSPLPLSSTSNRSLASPLEVSPAFRVVLLVGVMGSGKSTFGRNLHQHRPLHSSPSPTTTTGHFHWLESDGHHLPLPSLLSSIPHLLLTNPTQPLVIDRCSCLRAERRRIVESVKGGEGEGGDGVVCVFFDVDVTVCVERVWTRRGHPTWTEKKMQSKGKGYVKACIEAANRRMEEPTMEEGYEALYICRSNEDLHLTFTALTQCQDPHLTVDKGLPLPLSSPDILSSSLDPSFPSSSLPPSHLRRVALVKFPRTPHVLDPGGSAVGRSDLLLSPSLTSAFYGPTAVPLVVSEKVDGSNLGLTLSPSFTLLAYHRGHFVSPTTDKEFAALPSWLEEHSHALTALLSPPGGYVLYGEWCKALHSVPYTALPDYFLAFDMWDEGEGRFWGQKRLGEALRGSGVRGVGVLVRRRYDRKEELLEELERESRWRGDGGKVEGVVLRIETEDGRGLIQRGKLVRPDFVQAITTHWTKRKMIKNQMLFREEEQEEEEEVGAKPSTESTEGEVERPG